MTDHNDNEMDRASQGAAPQAADERAAWLQRTVLEIADQCGISGEALARLAHIVDPRDVALRHKLTTPIVQILRASQAAAPQAATASEREAFEAWAIGETGGWCPEELGRAPAPYSNLYAEDRLNDAWEAYQAASRPTFQSRVQPWMLECFGPTIAADTIERNHRFLEEALELVQSLGCTASEAHQLVDYTFGRPIGEPMQEVGGVMVTLAALCLASELDMHQAGETELARISEPAIVLKIRAKQAAKPKHSPLPQAVAARSPYEWRDTGPLETGEGEGA
ncbi:hypothetical protein [Burkholderia gladioli]|uniref:hypothetical protein n=1 Tax=Burkholderia gladioli TaxID=28095 RepID=UPI001FC8AFFA|nr:hypothetical protein [Burkholderia gladioli]